MTQRASEGAEARRKVSGRGLRWLRRALLGVAALLCGAVVTLMLIGPRPFDRTEWSDRAGVLTEEEVAQAGRFRWTEREGALATDGWQRGDSAPALLPAMAGAAPAMVWSRRDSQGRGALWMRAGELVGGQFRPRGEARPILSLGSAGDDTDPQAFPQQNALVFASDRAGGAGGYDLWWTQRSAAGWSEPAPLPGPVNSSASERGPALDPQGTQLVFSSDRDSGPGGPHALFRSERMGLLFGLPSRIALDVGPEPTAPVPEDLRDPSFGPAGRDLLFASDRVGGVGGYDLYVARSLLDGEAGEYASAEPLRSLNGPGDEFAAAWSAEGTQLLFARDVAQGLGGGAQLSLAHLERLNARTLDDGAWVRWLLRLLAALAAVLALLGILAWNGLHPIVKFVLASIVIHLLVLLFGRTGTPEVVLPELPERGFAVTFLPPPSEAEEDSDSGGSGAVHDARIRRAAESLQGSTPLAAAAMSSPQAEAPAPISPQERPGSPSPRPAPSRSVAVSAVPASAAPRPRSESPLAQSEAAPARKGESPLSPRAQELEAVVAAMPSESRSRRVVDPRVFEELDAGAPAFSAAAGQGALARGQARPEASRQAAAPKAAKREAGQPSAALARRAFAKAAVANAPRATLAKQAQAGAPSAKRLDRQEQAASALASEATSAKATLAAEAAEAAAAPSPSESAPVARAAPRPQRRAPRALARPRSAPAAALPARPEGRRSGPSLLASTNAEPSGQARSVAAAGPSRDREPQAQAVSARGGEPQAERSQAWRSTGVALPAEPARPSLSATLASDARGKRGARPGGRGAPAPPSQGRSGPAAPTRALTPNASRAGNAAEGSLASRRSAGPQIDLRSGADLSGRGLSDPLAKSQPSAEGLALPRPAPPSFSRSGVARPISALRPPRPTFAQRRLTRALAGAAAQGPSAAALASRSGAGRKAALERGGGDEQTEAAVLAGLRYLASKQRASGAWIGKRRDPKYGNTRGGRTGLALLAFLGAGYHQLEEDAEGFHRVVQRGLDFLASTEAEGGHLGRGSSYGHGIATYAIAEALALSGDERLRPLLLRAVGRIRRAQVRSNDERLSGGWGYYYADPKRRYDDWPRMSVTVWQIMALEGAVIAGVDVGARTLPAALSFVRASHAPQEGHYRYNQDPAWRKRSYATLPGSVSAALFARQLLESGSEWRQDAGHRDAMAFLNERPPTRRFRSRSDRRMVTRGEGNLYYLYYATLGLFFEGGAAWEAWNPKLKRMLLPAQREDGSWPTISYYARRGGDTDDDSIYTTAMCVLMLEVYYRYLPQLLRAR